VVTLAAAAEVKRDAAIIAPAATPPQQEPAVFAKPGQQAARFGRRFLREVSGGAPFCSAGNFKTDQP